MTNILSYIGPSRISILVALEKYNSFPNHVPIQSYYCTTPRELYTIQDHLAKELSTTQTESQIKIEICLQNIFLFKEYIYHPSLLDTPQRLKEDLEKIKSTVTHIQSLFQKFEKKVESLTTDTPESEDTTKQREILNETPNQDCSEEVIERMSKKPQQERDIPNKTENGKGRNVAPREATDVSSSRPAAINNAPSAVSSPLNQATAAAAPSIRKPDAREGARPVPDVHQSGQVPAQTSRRVLAGAQHEIRPHPTMQIPQQGVPRGQSAHVAGAGQGITSVQSPAQRLINPQQPRQPQRVGTPAPREAPHPANSTNHAAVTSARTAIQPTQQQIDIRQRNANARVPSVQMKAHPHNPPPRQNQPRPGTPLPVAGNPNLAVRRGGRLDQEMAVAPLNINQQQQGPGQPNVVSHNAQAKNALLHAQPLAQPQQRVAPQQDARSTNTRTTQRPLQPPQPPLPVKSSMRISEEEKNRQSTDRRPNAIREDTAQKKHATFAIDESQQVQHHQPRKQGEHSSQPTTASSHKEKTVLKPSQSPSDQHTVQGERVHGNAPPKHAPEDLRLTEALLNLDYARKAANMAEAHYLDTCDKKEYKAMEESRSRQNRRAKAAAETKLMIKKENQKKSDAEKKVAEEIKKKKAKEEEAAKAIADQKAAADAAQKAKEYSKKLGNGTYTGRELMKTVNQATAAMANKPDRSNDKAATGTLKVKVKKVKDSAQDQAHEAAKKHAKEHRR